MDEKENTKIILSQIDIYCSQITHVEKNMYQALFVFITVIGVAASLIFGKENLIPDIKNIKYIILDISQIEYLLIIFVMTMAIHQKLLSHYISSLESKLTEYGGTIFYHSKFVPYVIVKRTSLLIHIDSLFIIIGLIVFVLCFSSILSSDGSWYLYTILISEFMILIYFGIRFFGVDKQLRKYLRDMGRVNQSQ